MELKAIFKVNMSKQENCLKCFFNQQTKHAKKNKEIVERIGIFCSEIEPFMRFVLYSCNISQDDVLFKKKMDKGGGFFTVCLQVIAKNENPKAQKQ